MSAFRAWSLPLDVPVSPERSVVECRPGGGELRYPALDGEDAGRLVRSLSEARARSLLERPVREIARVLGRVGERFLDPDDPLRGEALEHLPGVNGISPAMARVVVEGMAREWTPQRLHRLLGAEFPDPEVLDRFRPGPGGGRIRALGFGVGFHVSAGTVPGVSVTSMIRGLLVKSAVLLKPGRGDAVLPVLFARGIREEDPDLADSVAVSYWPGGRAELEDAALRGAECVVVYGSDGTVRSLRDRTPVTARFVGYRHRLSFAMLGREGLADAESAEATARRAARAVAVFDQRGCVSPHLAYVEEGGAVAARAWAEMLADAFEAVEEELPSGPLLDSEASEIQQLRGTAEMRASAGRGSVRHGGPNPWTVLIEPDPGFQPSCLGRVVRIRPVARLEEALDEVEALGRVLQTVAVEGVAPPRRSALAESLGEIGAARITTLERTPWPPAWWRHDGRGGLTPLVRWIDLEGETERSGD